VNSTIIITAVMLTFSPLHGSQVVSDLTDERTIIETLVVPPHEFSRDRIFELANSFKRLKVGKRQLGVLSIFTDRSTAAVETGVSCEGNYKQWQVYRQQLPMADSLRAADVIFTRNGGWIRLKLPHQNPELRVLDGRDPEVVTIDGIAVEIMAATARKQSRFEGCGVVGSLEPVLQVRVSADLKSAFPLKATMELAKALGYQRVWVSFRRDPWFLCGRFGIMYPFSSPELPLSEEAYYGAPQYTCMVSCSGAAVCSGPMLRPSSNGK